MDVKDLLPMIFERSNASTTLWNIEFVVILGVLTFIATAKEHAKHWAVKSAVIALFLGAQYFNARALVEVSYHRQILRGIFEATHNVIVDPFISPAHHIVIPLRYTRPREIIIVFIFASVLGVLFLWLYPRDELPNFLQNLQNRALSTSFGRWLLTSKQNSKGAPRLP